MDDIRTTRTTPGFLAGRLLGLLDFAKHDILSMGADSRGRYAQIYAAVQLHPKAGIVAMAKEWASAARRLQVQDPKRWTAVNDDWTWIMGHLDVDALAAASLIDRGNEIVYGHAVEHLYHMGLRTAEARQTSDEWVARAKATAVAAVEAGMSESEAARLAGISRLTVRSALGK